MNEFFFYNTSERRNKTEIMHDMLITAKDGIKRTPLMSRTNMCWKLMHELLKVAQDAGLIEEVEIQPAYWRMKPTRGWKTTEKGLQYARTMYENYKLLEGEVKR